MLLKYFDPPAHMNDFDSIPEMRGAWHEFVSTNCDYCVAIERQPFLKPDGSSGTLQLHNPANFASNFL